MMVKALQTIQADGKTIPPGSVFRWNSAWGDFREYVDRGVIRRDGPTKDEVVVESDLPEDLPGRAALMEGGYTTVAQVLEIDDYQLIPGIGKATAEKLAKALAEALAEDDDSDGEGSDEGQPEDSGDKEE